MDHALALALLCAPVSAQVWEACPPRQTLLGEAGGDQYGWVAQGVGDVDADGVQDFASTAPFHDTAGNNAGRGYVYSGASGALLFVVDGPGAGANLGFAVSAIGDLNGDGHAEVVFGAPAVGSGVSPGRVLIYSGRDGSLLRTLTGESAGDQFGASVAGPGDVDGDGTPELFVGAVAHDTGGQGAGRAYVYSGATWARLHVFDGLAAGDGFGSAVAGIGDRNADGSADLVVGAPGAAAGGQAYVFDGATGSLERTLDTDASGVNFGQFFAGFIGDVNADATPDFFVSDWSNGALGAGTGRVFVYSGVDFSLLHTLTGRGAGQGYGIGRGWAGDVDGDGHDDMLFGSWLGDLGGANAGDVTVHSGADGRLLARWTSSLPGANLGFDAAGLGDVDGDGAPDFLASAATANGMRGITYVFSGADPRPPRAYCEGRPNSVGAGGRMTYRRSISIAENDFRVRVEGVPAGVLGLFYYGSTALDAPFGDGRRCVAGATARLSPVGTTSSSGSLQRPLDFTRAPLASGPARVTGGSTWNFQFWYRDAAAGGAGFNLSDALAVTFCD